MFYEISEQEQKNITQQIDIYLKTTFKDKIKGARAIVNPINCLPRHFIVMARRNRFYDLYIRFNSDYYDSKIHYKTIVLARFFLENTRRKIGSNLLYELIQITRGYNYKYIMIEGVNDNSMAFAKRLGFEEYIINPSTPQPAFSYFISIERLDPFLKSYLKLAL